VAPSYWQARLLCSQPRTVARPRSKTRLPRVGKATPGETGAAGVRAGQGEDKEAAPAAALVGLLVVVKPSDGGQSHINLSKCGDGVLDTALGEQCDDGIPPAQKVVQSRKSNATTARPMVTLWADARSDA